jgi:hypothetical protein
LPISAYSPSDARSRLADWVEVAALTSLSKSQTRAQFLRAVAALDEPVFDDDDEDLGYDREDEEDGGGDRFILDERQENLADRVAAELEYRSTLLGTKYPFDLQASGVTWKLQHLPATTGADKFAQRCYEACLLVSAIKYKFLNLDSGTATYKEIAKHFQLLAYFVAPAVVGGSAYWMGWPRPDSTKSLRRALDAVTGKMTLGRLHGSDPAWDAGYAKDGTVDIVAWKHFAGRTPGAIVLYGQVASGMNWRTKPLKAYFDPYFTGWFASQPAAEFVHSMFIPFPVYERCKPKRTQSFESLAYEEAVRDERTFGIVIDRLRITELARARYEQLKGSGQVSEEFVLDGFVSLDRWRTRAMALGQ